MAGREARRKEGERINLARDGQEQTGLGEARNEKEGLELVLLP